MDQLASAPGVEIRESILTELEQTRKAYNELFQVIPEEAWSLPSGNPHWTIKEVLFHITVAPRLLPQDVLFIRRLGWLPRPPAFLFRWWNDWYTRRGAKRNDRDGLAQSYDEAHERTMRALATIGDNEWDKGADYPGWDPILSGFVSLEKLFRYPAAHFEAYGKEIVQKLDILTM